VKVGGLKLDNPIMEADFMTLKTIVIKYFRKKNSDNIRILRL